MTHRSVGGCEGYCHCNEHNFNQQFRNGSENNCDTSCNNSPCYSYCFRHVQRPIANNHGCSHVCTVTKCKILLMLGRYFQCGVATGRTVAITSVLDSFLPTLFFNQIRTVEQLGYVAQARSYADDAGFIGINFIINSNGNVRRRNPKSNFSLIYGRTHVLSISALKHF